MSLLDDISAEIGQLSDEDIAKAAAQILERKEKAKAAMTPERAQKMKDREKKRRQYNSELLKVAKAKGLIAAPAGSTAATTVDEVVAGGAQG